MKLSDLQDIDFKNVGGLPLPVKAVLLLAILLAVIAAGVEFVLEGLHLNKRLNKDRIGARFQYRG